MKDKDNLKVAIIVFVSLMIVMFGLSIIVKGLIINNQNEMGLDVSGREYIMESTENIEETEVQ